MSYTILLGAEGCAEIATEPWCRAATAEEIAAFQLRFPDVEAMDDNGRPYWHKVITDEAPEWAVIAARCTIRTKRLRE